MAITLGSNIPSLVAQRQLARSSEALSDTFQKLASGMRINRASDDAAGLSIASSLNVDSRVFTQAIRNLSDGNSYLSVAEGALSQLNTIVSRQLELSEQAANGTYSLAQRRGLNAEAVALQQEFDRIVASAEFNGRKIFDASSSGLRLQGGYGLDGSLQIALGSGLGRTAGDGTYQTAVSYAVATLTQYANSADLDGDGNLDLVVSGNNTSRQFVLMGNGNGTFEAAVSYFFGSTPIGTILEDVNGDNKVDLLTTSSGGFFLSVSLGNGDGTFKAYSSYANSFATGSAAILADVNGDGIKDAVASSATSANIAVLIGNNNGSFNAPITSATLGNAREVTAGDINGDGVIDLIVASTTSVYYTLGNNNGTFSAPTTIIGLQHSFVETGDFNDDGITDLITGQAAGAFRVLHGNGDATYKVAQTWTGVTSTTVVQNQDLNGDGIEDLLVGNTTGMINLLFGNVDGTFAAPTTISGTDSPRQFALGDFNQDGAVDIAGAHQTNGAVEIFYANPTTLFTQRRPYLLDRQSALVSLEQFKVDLIRITDELGVIGAAQSRIQTGLGVLATSNTNFKGAASRIMDADVAEQSSELIKRNIIRESAASVLAQANQQPILALQLLR